MNYDESEIQKSIVEIASMFGIFVFSVPNEAAGGYSVQRVERFKAMGLRPGMSDLIYVGHGGLIGFMEVKTDKGKLSKKQKEFKDQCESMNWRYAVVRSASEAMEIFKIWKTQDLQK